jgi:dihydrofolate reductase
MAHPRIRLYVAVSLDGFIADTSGGVEWLQPYETEDVGFSAFFREIGAIVSGRRTYDQSRGFPSWPYPGKRVVVLTSRPLDVEPPDGVEAYRGDLTLLADKLKRETSGDIWILGGARVAQDFLERGLIDRIELYIIPVLLGDGVRLFSTVDHARTLAFSEAKPYPNGIVGLIYELAPKLRAV